MSKRGFAITGIVVTLENVHKYTLEQLEQWSGQEEMKVYRELRELPVEQRTRPEQFDLVKGERLLITGGKFEGRTCQFDHYCTDIFPTGCVVILDMKPKQRKEVMVVIELEDLVRENDEPGLESLDIYEAIEKPVVEWNGFKFNEFNVCLNPEKLVEHSGKLIAYEMDICQYNGWYHIGYSFRTKSSENGRGESRPCGYGDAMGSADRKAYILSWAEYILESLQHSTKKTKCQEYEKLEKLIHQIKTNTSMATTKKGSIADLTKESSTDIVAKSDDHEVMLYFKKMSPDQQEKQLARYLEDIAKCDIKHMKPIYERGMRLLQQVMKEEGVKAVAGTNWSDAGGYIGDPGPLARKLRAVQAATNLEEVTSAIKEISLDEIMPDPNQPRKFFDDAELQGLAQSIDKARVIQPILLRPVSSVGGGWDEIARMGSKKYMIVFGERRWRASILARVKNPEITTIPAMIRELTDDETLELQITENLQRHGQHPMEEAAAFERMKKRYSVDEIALRYGKSTKFVAGRLMLNKLIPGLQELFFKNKFNLGDALLLAKVPAEDQQKIYNERVPKNWHEKKDWTLEYIEDYVEGYDNNLDGAPFKTEDAELYPEMGACGKCPFNSSNNLTLFTEEKGRICGNPVCYNIKCERSYAATLQEVIVSPDVVFIKGTYHVQKDKIAAVKEAGGAILEDNNFREVDTEEKPKLEDYYAQNANNKPVWDEYLAERKKQRPDWEKNVKKFEKECKEEFDEELQEWEDCVKEDFNAELGNWQDDIDELEAAKKEGRVRKAFVIAGGNAGKIVDVIVTGDVVPARGDNGQPGQDISAAQEIKGIQEREKRAKELDAEKVWAQVRGHAIQTKNNWFDENMPLDQIELRAVCQAMYECISNAEKVCKDIFKIDHWGSGPRVAKKIEQANEKQLMQYHNRLCRELMRSKLFDFNYSHEHSSNRYWGKKLMEYYDHLFVKKVDDEQAAKAAARIKRVNERIADLKKTQQRKTKSNE